MELKEGYKQTEVGVIPEDWRIKPLSAVAFFTNGKAHEQFIDDNGDYIVVNSKFISTEGDVFKNSSVCICPLKKGDITMVMSDIPNGKALAKCFIIPKDNKYTLNQRICSLSTEISEKRFLAYILNRNKYYLAFDSGTGQTNLKKNDVIGCPIPLPPTKDEQTAIATALSDADALIQSLEKLIAKKQNIKQGAMQELLKPKEGWVVKKLGEICEINMGQSPSSSNYNASGVGLPLVQGNSDIADRKTIIRNYTSQITKRCNNGDIIMSVRAPVGEIAIATFDACIGRGVCAISYSNAFLYHYLIFIEPQWAKHSTGSTFDSVNSDTIWALEIDTPPPPEQTRIATILSDMDAEIATLETKLAKYKQVKQGMMQELLTGRTRLV